MKYIRVTALLAALVLALAVGAVAWAAHGAVTDPATLAELERVREATDQYHDVAAAEADGYENFGWAPTMGYHYANVELMDGTFDLERPPILLYFGAPHALRLVGVEYLVLDGPPGVEDYADGEADSEPEGFTGDSDPWWFHPAMCEYEDGYEFVAPDPSTCPETSPRGAPMVEWHEDLWLLHVWLWQGNPKSVDALFNPAPLTRMP